MEVKLFTFVILWTYGVIASEYNCSQRSALLLLRRPAYEFSIRMLQRVTEETDAHFVYSPVSTWLQLTALAEGADGRTLNEIWRVTKHHKNRCFKRQLGRILNNLNFELRSEMKRKSVIAIDKLLAVKKKYIRDLAKLYGIQVLLLAFNEPDKSVRQVNELIKDGTSGVIERIMYYDDFNATVLLMSDASYFRSEWKTPFTSVGEQPFYSRKGDKIGKVSMMNQVGLFNVVDFPYIGATVLEIPCANKRIRMLVFLPHDKLWVSDIFYSLQTTRLTSIFNMYKRQGPQLVNVTMPKFKQRSEIDNLPELVYDMGVRRIFDPNAAEFKGISKYKLYASLMTQITDIEVNEKGVNASASFLVRNNGSAVEFSVNRPFAYVIVDKVTDFILYAGIYSLPPVV